MTKLLKILATIFTRIGALLLIGLATKLINISSTDSYLGSIYFFGGLILLTICVIFIIVGLDLWIWD